LPLKQVHAFLPIAVNNFHHDLYIFFCSLSCVGDVETNSKPVIGMAFGCLEDVENFYGDYACDARFPIRIGRKRKRLMK
jgi:hypothetical protein